MASKHGPLFSAPTANLYAFMDALDDAVALVRDREMRRGVDPVRPLDLRDEAAKGDFVVSEFVRSGVLEATAVGRLADMVVDGPGLSADRIVALRDVVSGWLTSRSVRFVRSLSDIEGRLIATRIPAAAALVVERAMREVVSRVFAVQVGAVSLPRRRGAVPVPSTDYLLTRAAWAREVSDPQLAMSEAERAVSEGRGAIRRIRRRALDAARMTRPVSRRRKA